MSRFSVVPAAYVLLHRGDEVLLQLRFNTGYMDGYWAFSAAGHVERGESVLDAAVRETREEIGVDVRPGDLESLCAMHRTQAGGDPVNERVDFFFTVTMWAGTPHIVEPDKAADLAWFPIRALPSKVVPHEQVVLDALLRGAVEPVISYGF